MFKIGDTVYPMWGSYTGRPCRVVEVLTDCVGTVYGVQPSDNEPMGIYTASELSAKDFCQIP